jgi:hypothetical protein
MRKHFEGMKTMRVLNWVCVPQINDIMRKEDRSWNIRSLNTTFLIFMKKLEDEVSEEASLVQFSPRDLHFRRLALSLVT